MTLPRLLIATGNLHKYGEIAAFLKGTPWDVLSLRDFTTIAAPEETGDSFESNAFIKASTYCAAFGVACVADDSGLVVDVLGGAPGIYSARYAGADCTDAENNAKLLYELRGVPAEERTARFVCCAAFVAPDGSQHSEQGAVEGRIAFDITGANGFGYDPLFVPEGFDVSYGALSPDVKSSTSHRARAFQAMRAYLETRNA